MIKLEEEEKKREKEKNRLINFKKINHCKHEENEPSCEEGNAC